MRSWIMLGFLGIIINELANHLIGKQIKIDGKKLVQYIFMLALGPATAGYAIYRFFNASPVDIEAKKEEETETKEDVTPEQKENPEQKDDHHGAAK
ncbi:MAG TPA: hypothetical protein VI911_02480 [Patescibacteria group bacterium]|nr:hypothetical protein [Patescibacteria group bacterium]